MAAAYGHAYAGRSPPSSCCCCCVYGLCAESGPSKGVYKMEATWKFVAIILTAWELHDNNNSPIPIPIPYPVHPPYKTWAERAGSAALLHFTTCLFFFFFGQFFLLHVDKVLSRRQLVPKPSTHTHTHTPIPIPCSHQVQEIHFWSNSHSVTMSVFCDLPTPYAQKRA